MRAPELLLERGKLRSGIGRKASPGPGPFEGLEIGAQRGDGRLRVRQILLQPADRVRGGRGREGELPWRRGGLALRQGLDLAAALKRAQRLPCLGSRAAQRLALTVDPLELRTQAGDLGKQVLHLCGLRGGSGRGPGA